ncbi:MAG: DNA gyrase subunit A, partial [Gemmatimonadota bacterium]
MVRMVQDFSLRYPLVDGQGNFGSIDGDSAAAYRYTEARLASVAMELLADIGAETVSFSPNFDARLEEPTVLPTRLPNLLVNGSSGIAVGMSTNIPPHNLNEVAAAIRLLVENPECTVAEMMTVLPGPDFPTGGFIVGADGIRDMYETGRGRIIMRARVVKEALRGGKEQLVVTELPYAVSKTKIIEQIVAVSRKGQLEDVSDIRDESDRDGLRLVIELKRGANSGAVLNTLFRRSYLQATFGAIVLALDHGEPKEFNLKQVLERYRDHRLDVIQRRSRHELEAAEAEKHIVEGLAAALDYIDEVIRIIRDSRDRPEASERLQERFGLSGIQADAILNMRLGKLTSLEREELAARLEELEGIIKELRAILGSEERQLEVMLEELAEVVERFGDRRRTVILADAEEHGPTVEDTVGDEDVVVTVSHQGYMKRIPMHLYRRRLASGKELAGMENFEDDYLERVFTTRTTGWILAFTEGGHAHFIS